MSVKILTGLAIAALLTGCGGANDHPEELKGTWSAACARNVVETYIFDSGLTMNINSYSDVNCTDRRAAVTFKLSAMYDPELKTTSSGTEALKAELTLAGNITFTPYDSFALQSYKNTCPQQNWVMGQATSIMACEHASAQYLISSFEPSLPMLLYVNGNDLYTSKTSGPKDADGFPRDVNYETSYAKQ